MIKIICKNVIVNSSVTYFSYCSKRNLYNNFSSVYYYSCNCSSLKLNYGNNYKLQYSPCFKFSSKIPINNVNNDVLQKNKLLTDSEAQKSSLDTGPNNKMNASSSNTTTTENRHTATRSTLASWPSSLLSSSRGNISPAFQRKVDNWGDVFNRWYSFYQDFAGISEVHRAQEKVNNLMDDMSGMTSRRRELQLEIAELHHNLNSVHSRITNSPRYSEEHTMLFEQARNLNQLLLERKREFELTEQRERDCLTQVMSAIRVSHERERTQQQHTSYRTLTLSLASAAAASIITLLTNLKRARDTGLRIAATEQHATDLHLAAESSGRERHGALEGRLIEIMEALQQRGTEVENLEMVVKQCLKEELSGVGATPGGVGVTSSVDGAGGVQDNTAARLVAAAILGAVVAVAVSSAVR